MSRTRKTDPRWVRELRYGGRPNHWWKCPLSASSFHYLPGGFVPCDLDDETVPPRRRHCGRELPYELDYWVPDGHPNKEDRRLYWNGSARAEERGKLREATKEYRANGEIEHVDLDHQQHRHGVTWYLW